VGGQDINYTATAANYVIKADDGTPKVSIFFVSYVKDDVADITRRPVSFIYNGGPGSASMYTHMGLGPKRIKLTDDGHGMPAPYEIEENGDSFLDATDMVFVDAPTTGYSRVAPGENPSQFYGVTQDATAFADFIYQYITRNNRWASPKFLIGESYGTTRSAQLASTLQSRHQIYLNGVALLSAVGFGNWGAGRSHQVFLPDLRDVGLVSQAAARRIAEAQRGTSGAGGARFRARSLRAGAGERRPDSTRRAPEDREGDGASHRSFAEVHRVGQPARQPAALVQGVDAR
jgi:hypothetical protein